ncbi:MAG: hypothetical protein KI790_02985 [Cyclobacteriaceae bacterium]|nr:hypothetical protein [Cyclobacteriaceae bacterium HetDA_MAG_MS6]
MKKIKNFIWVFPLLLFGSCFDPPEFPDEPSISFKRIRFVPVDQAADSLILSFEFEDGNGDIGLRSSETLPPYHSFNVILDSRDSLIYVNADSADIVPPLLRYDILGNFINQFSEDIYLPPYSCDEYFIFESQNDSVPSDNADTILIERNVFNKNIYIDFYRKVGGNYVNINDELSPGNLCDEAFDSRIPVFDEDNIGRSLSGTISYSLLSQGFGTVFRNDTIQLRFFIYDRDLNKSNEAVTSDFVLANITDN